MPAAPRPSCVRCVITSSRLYTTPSVTLRRHKAAAASSPSFARALNYEYTDGVDYRGLTALTSLSMAVSDREPFCLWGTTEGLGENLQVRRPSNARENVTCTPATARRSRQNRITLSAP
ncbi:hypothetical protein [Candidatus Reidiella endopervernicosa]|uniref:Uncharacterized protein n=1 Tax=Candidatus Reidiella endopervernicosa TaxID=2738883 RepID=A0A6N0HY73_9GAMM|nr:hypothetical protein [Candidatus Reidiella endopervernicosa]QKQ27318.1 hypothetical protein HUE57_14265 [Candidatus Reidiella endopervernicosa]